MAKNNDDSWFRINLTALKRLDSYIKDIVGSASQVALYKYNASEEWEKTEIEGALFVYKRSTAPCNGFIIMNRLSVTNLIEPLTPDMEFQNQQPFLLYKTDKKGIYGIWFYDKEECNSVCSLMDRLTQEMRLNHNPSEARTGAVKPQQTSAKTCDILSILNKAQTEFDVKTRHTVSNDIKIGNQEPPPQAVPANFTGSMGDGNRITIINQIPNGNENAVSPAEIVRPMPVRPLSVNNGPLTVQDLFAAAQSGTSAPNAADLTHDIPKDAYAGWLGGGGTVHNNPKANDVQPSVLDMLKNADRLRNKDEQEVNGINAQKWMSAEAVEKDLLGKLHVGHMLNVFKEEMRSEAKQQANNNPNTSLCQSSEKDNSVPGLNSIMNKPRKTSGSADDSFLSLSPKIELMSPMMFSATQPVNSRCGDRSSIRDKNVPAVMAEKPLLKQEFVAAFKHFLDNNDDFVTDLYQAYLQTTKK